MFNDNIVESVELAVLALAAEKDIERIYNDGKAFEEQVDELREVVLALKDSLEEHGLYTDEAFENDIALGFEANKLIQSTLDKAKKLFLKGFKEDDIDYTKKLSEVKGANEVDAEKYLKRFASVTNGLSGDLVKDVEAIFKLRNELIDKGIADLLAIPKLAKSYGTLFIGGKVDKFDATDVSKLLKDELDIKLKNYKKSTDGEIVAMTVPYNDKEKVTGQILYIENTDDEGKARVKRMSIEYYKHIPSSKDYDNEQLKKVLSKMSSDIAGSKIYKERLDAYGVWSSILNFIKGDLLAMFTSGGAGALAFVATRNLAIGHFASSFTYSAMVIKIVRNVLATYAMVNGTKKLVYGIDKDLLELERTLGR